MAYDQVLERPNMWYIFEKRIVQGYQKLYYKVPEKPNMWHIFEKTKRIVQGYQKLYTHVPNTKIQRHKYTITQIHKYSV